MTSRLHFDASLTLVPMRPGLAPRAAPGRFGEALLDAFADWIAQRLQHPAHGASTALAGNALDAASAQQLLQLLLRHQDDIHVIDNAEHSRQFVAWLLDDCLAPWQRQWREVAGAERVAWDSAYRPMLALLEQMWARLGRRP